jgi:2-dehydro-3-deoxyphosphogluconate aldolase / (4S)-4-hydroxy-2-oxoglutarate aldolase
MARFSRLEVLNRIVEVGLVPVFYHGDFEVASQVLAACAAGGVTVFEFTNRGDHAIDVFRELARRAQQQTPDLILGAGSIVDEATAALYVAHGANFIVGPLFNERVARFCNRRKIAYLPGCATATEIATAEEAGVEIVKLFPCELVGGPEFVKALLGPCPWTRIMVTGISQVTKAGLAEWFKAGIVAAGIGRELLKKEFLDQRDYAAITRRAAEIRQWIQEARGR